MSKIARPAAPEKLYPLLDRTIAYITATPTPSSHPEPLRLIMIAEADRLRKGLPTRRETEAAVLNWLMAEVNALIDPPEPTPKEVVQKALGVAPVKAAPPAPVRDAHHCLDVAARGLSVLLTLLDGCSTQTPLDPDGLYTLIEPIDTQINEARQRLSALVEAQP